MAIRASRTEREAGLLGRFLATRFTTDRVIFNVRLGPIPLIPGVSDIPGLPWNALQNFRRWADAVVIQPDKVRIIEAKTIMDPGLPSTLELYKLLWLRTPEYQAFRALDVVLMAVVAFDDPVLSAIARRHGVEVVVFTPPDIAAELAAKYFSHKNSTVPSLTPPEILE
jgi:hypothetical protein